MPRDRCNMWAAESMVWRCLKELPNSPPACAGHTMTTAGRHGVLAFGGAGKHCSGALHCFHARTLTWQALAASGVRPTPAHTPVRNAYCASRSEVLHPRCCTAGCDAFTWALLAWKSQDALGVRHAAA